MEISLLLLREIIKLFLVMLAGMSIVKAGLLKSSDSKVLSVLLVYLIMPCTIINSFQIDATKEVQKGLVYALICAVIAHIIFILANELLKRICSMDYIEQTSIIYSNAGILVIPLVKVLLGEEYLIYSFAFIVVQLVLLWSHANILISGKSKIAIKEIVFNNNIISIFVGLLLFLLRIQLPEIVSGTMQNIGSMLGTVGMLLSGMVIAESSLKKLFLNARNYLPAVLRLIILPVLTLIVLKGIDAAGWLSDGKSILMVVYLATITPTCATLTSMAQLYQRNAIRAGEVYVLSTILSIITMPLLLGAYMFII